MKCTNSYWIDYITISFSTNVWFQKISIATPRKVIRNSEGERVSTFKRERMKLEIPGGWEG